MGREHHWQPVPQGASESRGGEGVVRGHGPRSSWRVPQRRKPRVHGQTLDPEVTTPLRCSQRNTMGVTQQTPGVLIHPGWEGGCTPAATPTLARVPGSAAVFLAAEQTFPGAWREGYVRTTAQPWCGNGGRGLPALGQCHPPRPPSLRSRKAWTLAFWSRAGEDFPPSLAQPAPPSYP